MSSGPGGGGYHLGLHQGVEQRLEQRLMLTQQMQQALQILQMQTLELAQWLENELQQNPTLEDATINDDPPDAQPEAVTGEDTLTPEIRQKEKEDMSPEEESERETINWERFDDGRDLGFGGASTPTPEDTDERPIENVPVALATLEEHLLRQLTLMPLPPAEMAAATAIISEINADGYYSGSLDALARGCGLSAEQVLQLLRLIQSFEPAGVGARDPRECFLIQLALLGEQDTWTYRIIDCCLEDLSARRFVKISRHFNLTPAKVEQAYARLQELQPYPGSTFDAASPQYIIPDVIVQKIDHQYEVVVNDEHLPHLRISARYQQIYEDKATGKETRDYLKKKIEDAEWVVRSIHQRHQTIHLVAKTLINLQYDFIENGFAQLKPLTLRHVADQIGMSESTVSRVTSNKYMQIPRGIFRMRVLFSGEIPMESGTATSSRAVQTTLRRMIEAEDAGHPLTDSEIHRRLTRDGMQIARRTICKYREELGILPAKLRRKK